MNSINGTNLIMNDGEKIFVEHTKEEINNAIDEAIAVKRNYITITHLDRDIYFNYIKDKESKVRYLSLEAPKQEYKDPTPEQRQKYNEFLDNYKNKFYDIRKKNFIEKRQKILDDLVSDEKMFGLETTIDKLEDYNKLKLTIQKGKKKI